MGSDVVVDASVAAKWYLLDEPNTRPAARLLTNCLAGEDTIHVPTLFYYEVAA